MMRLFYKILSTLILIPVIYFLFITGGISLVEAYNPISPYIDTEFAPDYSPKKFNLITEDFTYNEVIELIGEPLYDHFDEYLQCDCISYTNDGKALSSESNKFVLISDFAWYISEICFDSNGKIIRIEKGWAYD